MDGSRSAAHGLLSRLQHDRGSNLGEIDPVVAVPETGHTKRRGINNQSEDSFRLVRCRFVTEAVRPALEMSRRLNDPFDLNACERP